MRLKHLAILNPETLTDATDPDYAFRYIDIGTAGRGYLRAEPEFMTFGVAPSRARRVLRPGDTILSTVRTYLRTAWTVRDAPDQLVASTGFVCLRPRDGVDARYLGWLAQSDLVVEEVAARSVGVSYPAIKPDDVGEIEVLRPPPLYQRTIADYLDRETARIDALISATRRMVELVEERWQGSLETAIQALSETYGEVPLKYVCRGLSVGIVVKPAAWYTDTGVPALRGSNIEPGNVHLADLVFLTPEGHARHLKSRLNAGDIVIVRTGQVGAAAVVPQELDGANCIDLVIVRPSPDYSPDFLTHVLNSDWMQKHIQEHSVGTIQSHFNVGAAAKVPVPKAPRGAQAEAITQLDATRRRVISITGARSRQMHLLHERRQALITAAVTGQLDIPEAA